LRHREAGPAVEHQCGTKEWWVNGVAHREDGHAVYHAQERWLCHTSCYWQF